MNRFRIGIGHEIWTRGNVFQLSEYVLENLIIIRKEFLISGCVSDTIIPKLCVDQSVCSYLSLRSSRRKGSITTKKIIYSQDEMY